MGNHDHQSRSIFLGMPSGYGRQTPESARGYWRATRNPSQITYQVSCGSLLAANFNRLWVAALNMVHRGEQVDYFAMLHDDVGPEDYWLDALIDELEARNLDLLGVVVPIKDRRGMTSIALHQEGENWRPRARLTMHEVHQLPETFTSEDVGSPLLLNTGCWVCRFDSAWAKKVHFEINDRIVFNKATNQYEFQTEPEDWFFSRLCHEQGLRIGATRKVKVLHRGEMDFTNAEPWGTNYFDQEAVAQSSIPTPFPYDVLGWLDSIEGAALRELASGKRVLEIGSYCGRSTICLAQSAVHVTAVDWFDGRGTPYPENTRQVFERSLQKYGVRHKVAVQTPDDPVDASSYDLVFIDGDHAHDAVRADIDKALAALKPGGLLAFHDYRAHIGEHDGHWDPGVTDSVNELVAAGGEIVAIHKTLAVVRPPAAVPLEA